MKFKFFSSLCAIFLAGCIAVFSYDRTNEPITSLVSNKCFLTKKESLIFNFCSKSRYLQIVHYGAKGCIPQNASEFSLFKKRNYCGNGGDFLEKTIFPKNKKWFCGINLHQHAPKNTKIYIKKVEDTAMGETGRFWTILADIPEISLKNIQLPSDWFSPYWAGKEKVKMNDDYLEECK